MLLYDGSSLPSATVQSQENQILADFEGMLSGNSADRGENGRVIAQSESVWARRLAALVVLAGVGAALALVPIGLKSGMVTGRSVATVPQAR